MWNKVLKNNLMMLKFISNHFRTGELCGRGVRKFFYAFSYVPDQCETQQICESVVLKNIENINFSLTTLSLKKCVKSS